MWQPIATAPRDGTWFVICNAEDGARSFEVGCYEPLMHDRYVDAGGGLYRRERTATYDWHGFNNFGRATHWMPLPPPPIAETPVRTYGNGEEYQAVIAGRNAIRRAE